MKELSTRDKENGIARNREDDAAGVETEIKQAGRQVGGGEGRGGTVGGMDSHWQQGQGVE